MDFIIEQQARFSADIEQLKEVQKKQAANLAQLTSNVQVLTVDVQALTKYVTAMQSEAGSRTMNKKEFAERLCVSVPTVDRWIAQRKIRPVKINGRVLFREHHLKDLLDRFDLSLTESPQRKRKK